MSALLTECLADAPRAGNDEPCEIDVVVWPGRDQFRRRAECRLLLVEAGASERCPARLRHRADQIETLTAEDEIGLVALLEEVG